MRPNLISSLPPVTIADISSSRSLLPRRRPERLPQALADHRRQLRQLA